MVVCRPFVWSSDRDQIAALDLTLSSDSVFDVKVEPLGFRLVQRSVTPEFQKQYELQIDDLAHSTAVVVAEDNGVLCGLVSLDLQSWNRRAAISHLYVHRPFRGRAVGAALLDAARKEATVLRARCIFAETQNTNAPAVKFYQRNGLSLCGLDMTLYESAATDHEIAVFFSGSLLL